MSATTSDTISSGMDTAVQSLLEWLEGPETTFLRLWYDTLNPDLLPENIEWHNADGSPYGGTFIGPKAVQDGYFTPLQQDFANWHVTVEEVLGSGNKGNIIVRGHFHGRARSTGLEVTVPFANFWRVRGGEIVSMQQYTDTRILADALRGKTSQELLKTRA